MWLSRRFWILGVAVLPFVLWLGAEAQAPRKGGVLRVGILGEPPALDAHWTTALVETLTNHIYEGLYTLDEDNRPIPMLAEAMPTVSPGRPHLHVQAPPGRQVPQRQGDDRPRTWSPRSSGGASSPTTGKALFAQVADVQGRRQVHGRAASSRRSRRSSVLALAVPNNFAAIYPKEIAEKFPPGEKVTEYVGHRPLQARGVEARPAHPDGPLRRLQAAEREAQRLRRRRRSAYVDEIRWIPVPGRGDPRGPGRDGRARLRRRPQRWTPTTG